MFLKSIKSTISIKFHVKMWQWKTEMSQKCVSNFSLMKNYTSIKSIYIIQTYLWNSFTLYLKCGCTEHSGYRYRGSCYNSEMWFLLRYTTAFQYNLTINYEIIDVKYIDFNHLETYNTPNVNRVWKKFVANKNFPINWKNSKSK